MPESGSYSQFLNALLDIVRTGADRLCSGESWEDSCVIGEWFVWLGRRCERSPSWRLKRSWNANPQAAIPEKATRWLLWDCTIIC